MCPRLGTLSPCGAQCSCSLSFRVGRVPPSGTLTSIYSSSCMSGAAKSAHDLGRALVEFPPSLVTSARRPTDPACEPVARSKLAWAIIIRASAISYLAFANCARLRRSVDEVTDCTSLPELTIVWLALCKLIFACVATNAGAAGVARCFLHGAALAVALDEPLL